MESEKIYTNSIDVEYEIWEQKITMFSAYPFMTWFSFHVFIASREIGKQFKARPRFFKFK